MRYAILADIHANLSAFEAVLRDIDSRGGVDELWCLGDIVGYGPDPSACISLLGGCPHVCVVGNHDWGVVDKVDVSDFNPDAAEARLWTEGRLGPDDRAYLEDLPLTLVRGDFTLVHGSPRQPLWEYLRSVHSAEHSFDFFETTYCLVGHSHVPAVFEQTGDGCVFREMPSELELGEARLIINPGAVGQPRDGDPRAAYAIYDEGERAIYHYRIGYDIENTQRRMKREGLPHFLVQRLSGGR